MGVMSKQLFDERFGGAPPCKQLHWAFDDSCTKFLWIFYSNIFTGCAKFFFPLSIIQICLNYKGLNGSFLSEHLKIYLTRTLSMTVCGCAGMSWSCSMSNLFGGVHFYHLTFIPGIVSAMFTLFGRRSDRIINAILEFSMVLETCINRAKYHDLMKITNNRLTVIFILNNVLLTYLLTHRNEGKKAFIYWIHVPPPIEDGKLQCLHKTHCFQYCLEGVVKYFLFGYSWNIIRKITKIRLSFLKKPHLLTQLLKSKRNLNFGFFLGTYVGVYRALTCYLSGRRNLSPLCSSVIAGLLSGLSFGIQPNIQIFCLGITTTLQLLYARLEKKFIRLQKLPTMLLLFLICNSILVHERLAAPDICPKDYMNMSTLLSSGQIDKLCKTLFQNDNRPIK